MGKVRGIRFSDIEEKQIEAFLNANPLIDFTTLAKLAILGFIKNPKIQLKAIKQSAEGGRRGV